MTTKYRSAKQKANDIRSTLKAKYDSLSKKVSCGNHSASKIDNGRIRNNFLASADKSEMGLFKDSRIKQGDKGKGVENLHTLLDAVGVVDPFGVSDGINALIYLGQGDFKNAGISVLGIVPYVGDTAKGARLGAKVLKFADKADDVADAGKALNRAENVENVAENGGKIAWKRMTAKESKKAAENLGYVKTNYLAKNGEPIYYNKKTKTYISQDVGSSNGMGSHNGGVWKMAKSPHDLNKKSTRMGTYDKELNKIGE